MLAGAEEARLTYLGVAAGRESADGILVIDIGGGSTELVFGSGLEVDFYASLQAGTVRHTERHLKTDPPAADDLEALADDVRGLVDAELGAGEGRLRQRQPGNRRRGDGDVARRDRAGARPL
jgi:exopolyphosphatase/guanosine-5'-triphosphate,3'-diphosphate pyrophosphatase